MPQMRLGRVQHAELHTVHASKFDAVKMQEQRPYEE